MNDVFYSGHLGRDPERRQAGQSTVARVSVANTRKFGQQNEREGTTWVDIEAWGGWADALCQFRKGEMIAVKGRLKLDVWQDQQSGQQRSKLLVTVEQIVNPKPRAEQDGQQGQGAPQQGQGAPQSYERQGDAWEGPPPQQQAPQQGYRQQGSYQQQRPQYQPQGAPPPRQDGGFSSAL